MAQKRLFPRWYITKIRVGMVHASIGIVAPQLEFNRQRVDLFLSAICSTFLVRMNESEFGQNCEGSHHDMGLLWVNSPTVKSNFCCHPFAREWAFQNHVDHLLLEGRRTAPPCLFMICIWVSLSVLLPIVRRPRAIGMDSTLGINEMSAQNSLMLS